VTRPSGPDGTSAVRVALVYPDLLGTYGDSGNATILAQRLRWRGQAAEVTTIHAGETVPASCDLYVVGGGEDLPQALAAKDLGRPGPLHRAVDAGATVLAVCAGLQILGTSFVGPDGIETDGLGLVDCRTVRAKGARAVGELVVDPHPDSGLPTLTGYENHGGWTVLGPGARPAGWVRHGVGNGAETGHGDESSAGAARRPNTDGIWTGRIWGSYLHGPALARNPALADLLLSWVVGRLEPIDDVVSEALRTERLAAARSSGSAAKRSFWPAAASRLAARGRRAVAGPPDFALPPEAEAARAQRAGDDAKRPSVERTSTA
jgi:CobQ-like glutamine amidotransferase family enzyme